MKVYKGTDKDMKCRGFQYELGVTVKSDDAIRCGDKGFHSCEAPFDVLRYYANKDGNRFFVATAGGKIDRTGADDSKIASSEITLDKEISFDELRTAQIEYTRAKAEYGQCCGDWSAISGGYESTLSGGNCSALAGSARSNIAGGDWSAISGGDDSNLTGGKSSTIAGEYRSNISCGEASIIAGGSRSILSGGDGSTISGGVVSTIAGGSYSIISGGYESTLSGGDDSLVVGSNKCSAKAGINSVIVLTEWGMINGKYTPVCVAAEIVDGKRIKADTWYKLVNGEFTEAE